MTIDEVIRELEEILFNVPVKRPLLESNAIRLGIEALKQLKSERQQKVGFWRDRLIGETEE